MKTSNAVVLVVALFGGLFYFGWRGISSRPPKDAEKRLILDADELEKLGRNLKPKCEKYTSKLHLDGTRDVDFEYDCGPTATIYINSIAEISRSSRGARESFAMSIAAYEAAMAAGGKTVDRRRDLLTLGDQHYAALLRNGTRTGGNVFVVRQGRVLHVLVLVGFYLDNPDDVHRLFAPLLEESKKQYGT
ncbi:MAG TPA: hypothetical protein VGQ36_27735 [Thermoanaerobaculia bacterium]|nr:hypothetical protein [Thermoanaerobaculia bacterium]